MNGYLRNDTVRRLRMLGGGSPIARATSGPLVQTANRTGGQAPGSTPGSVGPARPEQPSLYTPPTAAKGGAPGRLDVRPAQPGQPTVAREPVREGGGAGVQSSSPYVSRTGERTMTGAGQGAWMMSGGVPNLAQSLEETRRRTGLGSNFANAAQIAQRNAGLTSAMGARPELLGAQATGDRPWLNQTLAPQQQQQQQQEGGLSVGRTGRAQTAADEGEQQGQQQQGQQQQGQQQQGQQQQGQQQGQQEDDFDEEAFAARRQWAERWFRERSGKSIEEYARETGVPPEQLYALIMGDYVTNFERDPKTGKMGFRLNYGRLMREAILDQHSDMRSAADALGNNLYRMLDKLEAFIAPRQGREMRTNRDEAYYETLFAHAKNMSVDEFSEFWQGMIGGANNSVAKALRDWGYDKVNPALGVSDVMGDNPDPLTSLFVPEAAIAENRVLSPDEMTESIWGLGGDAYRSGVDAYNQSLAGLGGGGVAGAPGGIEGGYGTAPGPDSVRAAVMEGMEWLKQNVPTLDQGAVTELIDASNREADIRNAQQLRSAMSMGGRVGMTPGQSMGQQQQIMQQAGAAAAQNRAQIQMQRELQNLQAQMQHYAQGAQYMARLAQAAQNEQDAAMALEASRELAMLQNRLQTAMLELQWERQRQLQQDQMFGNLIGTGLGMVGGALLSGGGSEGV